jgi:predicted nucleotidyltransferase
MIDLDTNYLKEIKNILAELAPGCEARVFGSRVTGKAKKYSDIDIILVDNHKLDWRLIEKIKQALSESDIPIIADVLDWNALTPEFRKTIESSGFEVIQKPKSKISHTRK